MSWLAWRCEAVVTSVLGDTLWTPIISLMTPVMFVFHTIAADYVCRDFLADCQWLCFVSSCSEQCRDLPQGVSERRSVWQQRQVTSCLCDNNSARWPWHWFLRLDPLLPVGFRVVCFLTEIITYLFFFYLPDRFRNMLELIKGGIFYRWRCMKEYICGRWCWPLLRFLFLFNQNS